uniref:lysozyme inhibitor LprI family protein n=1 Tax=Algoriphagus sp. TaxID=1872435 RepID=UPI0040480DC2
MKKIKIVLFLLFFGQTTFGFCQTQAELNRTSYQIFKEAEAEMNEVYEEILNSYAEDSEFISNLKKAQQFWMEFRSLELKVVFPDREAGYYGSIQPLCVNQHMTALTQERTKRLRIWLIGTSEGDICSGTIKWTSKDPD